MALRPMILMVCDECRLGNENFDCTTEGCAFDDYIHSRECVPARSRRQMVEAAWEAMRNGRTCMAALTDLGMCPDRYEVEAVLSAAIPGLLDGES